MLGDLADMAIREAANMAAKKKQQEAALNSKNPSSPNVITTTVDSTSAISAVTTPSTADSMDVGIPQQKPVIQMPKVVPRRYSERVSTGETSMIIPVKRKALNEGEDEEYQTKAQKRNLRKTDHVFVSKDQMVAMADLPEILVPIRIELDLEGSILKDTFTWNLNERHITPERFSEILCTDLNISKAIYAPQISSLFRSQIQEFSPYFLECDAPVFPDSRITITLDISIGGYQLKDRFEWDLSSDLAPEEFSRQFVADLGLGGEYVTVIAHSIHEQILKSRMEEDLDGRHTLECGFRDEKDLELYRPYLEEITNEGLEKMSIDVERNSRRLRRESKLFSLGARRKSFYPEESTNRSKIAARMSNGKAIEDDLSWRCSHCLYVGATTKRDGPLGAKTLCNSCGLYFIVTQEVPGHRHELFKIL